MTGRETHELKVKLAPYLCSHDARKAVKFYVDVLGGRQDGAAWEEPNGRIGHVTVRFDDHCVVHVSDAYPEAGVTAPPARDEEGAKGAGGHSSRLCLLVDDVASCVDRCVGAGATVLMPLKDEPTLGRRCARIRDPDGHIWLLSSNVTHISDEQLEASRVQFAKTGQM